MIAVDGARIVYRRIGKRRTLVVLNGFGVTSADWDLALPDVWSELLDTSGTPNEQTRRLLFLL
jgi:hypothetical protein